MSASGVFETRSQSVCFRLHCELSSLLNVQAARAALRHRDAVAVQLFDAVAAFLESLTGHSRLSFRQTVGMAPNNAFKPKPLRSTKHMAEKACHVFGSTTRFGLT